MPRRAAEIERPTAARRRARLALGAGALVVLALSVGVASASAARIEGIWSFNAGKIAIQAEPGGTFAGTVVAPTKFAQCTHPVGEQVWSEITEQPDGSYWGLHQWYFATEACIKNPTLGLTAFRVLQSGNGAHFLEVCFSEPGSAAQPTIAPNGTASNFTFGCSNSALVSPLPSVSQKDLERLVRLPGGSSCLRRRAALKIHIHDPKNDPFTRVAVVLRSGGVRRVAKLRRHGHTTVASLNLRGLAGSTFTVTVRLTTALGSHLHRKRTYGICASKRHHRHRR